MLPLKSLALRGPLPGKMEQFPFSVPAIQTLGQLEFTNAVTLFVGENGSGKSTLLEGIAGAAGAVAAGSATIEEDDTLHAARELGRHLKLVWRKRTGQGFFLRAEDFFGYVKSMNRTRAELERELHTLQKRYRGRSQLALELARQPFLRELHDMEARYGKDLDGYSHGESFLRFFQSRFIPGGLHLLDEPEAPLSPTRQLALLAMIKEMVGRGAQFIIASHSPIILAYPGATIFSFDQSPIRQVAYEELEHVTLTRSFLNDPARYLRHL